MSDKFLVVIVGCNYMHPMIINGDESFIVSRIKEESLKSSYCYVFYKYNDKYDCFMPYGYIHNGSFFDTNNFLVQGVVYHG